MPKTKRPTAEQIGRYSSPGGRKFSKRQMRRARRRMERNAVRDWSGHALSTKNYACMKGYED